MAKIVVGTREIKDGILYPLAKVGSTKKPVVDFAMKEGMYYALMMIDVDAGSEGGKNKIHINGRVDVDPDRVWLHWLVVNANMEDKMGSEVVPYFPPKPPRGSGEHRYYFLVFSQRGKNGRIEIGTMGDNERANFPAKKFIERAGLVLVDHVMFRTINGI